MHAVQRAPDRARLNLRRPSVIAIENTRLFEEVQASTRELTESLDQQTASAEVLRVISSRQVTCSPVFDTIA